MTWKFRTTRFALQFIMDIGWTLNNSVLVMVRFCGLCLSQAVCFVGWGGYPTKRPPKGLYTSHCQRMYIANLAG
ncbi:hypothetical protein EURHEDRAFT_416013 [Aspergillus ruber CBS 135680]|uniref:Uncharacterized protein n=1 Tax=Aspergillus ruber (strain CBS 135680) TaxID=1388766 RepID=A0A017S5X2_ASPRC|nr:hypothetical protein EURHEDRAFT_416013 [Aspergillus ruber CBS 135680]